jgi:hypothetical protein
VLFANGTTGGDSFWQARDVTQSVGDVTYAVTNSTGSVGTCSGTLSGSTLDMRCTQTHIAGCTATYDVNGIATAGSPSIWESTYGFQWTGTCPSAGDQVSVGVTVTELDAPPMNVSGTYRHEGTWTNTGPGVPPISGTNTGTRVRTQAAGSSTVYSTVAIDGGTTSTCRAAIIGNVLHGRCLDPSGTLTSGVGTVTVGPPMTISIVTQRPLFGGPYTQSSGTVVETRL